jgi:NAD(P)-dependent dehydrogenase (short-subunit alcohol dehydrogenase family)
MPGQSDAAPLERRRFSDRVALVTGGNSGIGRGVCVALAREGAKVVVAARRQAEGDGTLRLIREAGGDAIFVATDVTQASSVRAMVQTCVEHYGRLDIAFNNAGITGSVAKDIVEFEESDFDTTVAVNLKGTWLCMKYEIPEMLRAGGGSIVNCSSTAWSARWRPRVGVLREQARGHRAHERVSRWSTPRRAYA